MAKKELAQNIFCKTFFVQNLPIPSFFGFQIVCLQTKTTTVEAVLFTSCFVSWAERIVFQYNRKYWIPNEMLNFYYGFSAVAFKKSTTKTWINKVLLFIFVKITVFFGKSVFNAGYFFSKQKIINKTG